MTSKLSVVDANILIDIEVGGFLERIFDLDSKFAVPDILFEEELETRHPQLPSLGLQVIELNPDSIMDVVVLAERYIKTGVSRNDLFALALASQEDCPLLTGDAALREISASEGLEVHGTIWLIDQLLTNKIVTMEDVTKAYRFMKRNDRRLPWAEVSKQLTRWKHG